MGPLQDPRQAGGLHDVFRRRYLLWLLVRKEVKVRYSGSALSMFENKLKPHFESGEQLRSGGVDE